VRTNTVYKLTFEVLFEAYIMNWSVHSNDIPGFYFDSKLVTTQYSEKR